MITAFFIITEVYEIDQLFLVIKKVIFMKNWNLTANEKDENLTAKFQLIFMKNWNLLFLKCHSNQLLFVYAICKYCSKKHTVSDQNLVSGAEQNLFLHFDNICSKYDANVMCSRQSLIHIKAF
jgi:hypothetical protein